MLIMVISRAWICFWRESVTLFAGTGVARVVVVRRARKGARVVSCIFGGYFGVLICVEVDVCGFVGVLGVVVFSMEVVAAVDADAGDES